MSTAQLLAAAAAGNAAGVARVLATGDVDIDAREGGRGGSGRTALHAAASAGHVAVVRTLLAAGADPTRRDAAGRTPLGAALFAPEFSRPVADALAGPTLGVQASHGSAAASSAAASDLALLPAVVAQLSGIAPLDAAALGAAAFLLDAGAPVDTRDGLGHTPLMLACRRGAAQLPLIRRLLASGAAPDAVDANGTSVLRHAMSSGSGALVEWLVDNIGEDALVPRPADFAPFDAAPGVVSSVAPLAGRAPPANHLLDAQPLTPEEEAAARRRARELAAGTAAAGAASRRLQRRAVDDGDGGGAGGGELGDFRGWQRSTGGGGSVDGVLYRYADRFDTFCPGGGSKKGRVACSGGGGASCGGAGSDCATCSVGGAGAGGGSCEVPAAESAATDVGRDAAPAPKEAAASPSPSAVPAVTPDATGDVPLADMPAFLSRLLAWRRRVHALRLRSDVRRAQGEELRAKWGEEAAAAEEEQQQQ
jgi:hypothetical protein